MVTQQMNWDWRVTEAEMNISFGGNEESQRRVKKNVSSLQECEWFLVACPLMYN